SWSRDQPIISEEGSRRATARSPMTTNKSVRTVSYAALAVVLGCGGATDDVTGTWKGRLTNVVPDYGLTLNLQQSGFTVSGNVTEETGSETQTFAVMSGTYFRPQLSLSIGSSSVLHLTVYGSTQMVDDGSGVALSKQ